MYARNDLPSSCSPLSAPVSIMCTGMEFLMGKVNLGRFTDDRREDSTTSPGCGLPKVQL